jgi:hypothetical protein
MHANRLAVIALIAIAGCAEARLRPLPLPELVAAAEPAPAAPTVRELWLPADESLIWDVHFKGLTIARAELAIRADEVHSRLRTGALASALAKVDHELKTTIDRAAAHPKSAIDRLEADGESTEHAVIFDGASYTIGGATPVRHDVPNEQAPHTLHSALGWLRAWAHPDAAAAYLYVVHAGALYRLEVARPMFADLQGAQTIRIDGRVRANSGNADPIAITMWLTADEARLPKRVEISNPRVKLTAELITE